MSPVPCRQAGTSLKMAKTGTTSQIATVRGFYLVDSSASNSVGVGAPHALTAFFCSLSIILEQPDVAFTGDALNGDMLSVRSRNSPLITWSLAPSRTTRVPAGVTRSTT